MMTDTDLSTRVSALSGPDRAVDAEIAEAIGWLDAQIGVTQKTAWFMLQRLREHNRRVSEMAA